MRNLRPRKSLGQSFLTYEPTADALVEALGAGPDDAVLEIGPGKGMLTQRLAGRVRQLTVVEVDTRLAAGLQSELGLVSGLEVVCMDFLRYDLTRHRDLLVLGNLPYNLSSQMLFRLLAHLDSWRMAVLTTQREFAQRLLAVPGGKEYGALTVFFDRLTERERLFNIPPNQFKPRPDVVSTALRLRRRSRPAYSVVDEDQFRTVVRACFGQRRKTIANNLVSGLGLSRAGANQALESCGIEPMARAETIDGERFSELTAALSRSDALASGVTEPT